MIKKVTKQQYWQITGLLALAETTVARLGDLEKSIRSVLEVQKSDEGTSGVGDPQHIGDAIYSGYSPGKLLEKLGIATFVERPRKPRKTKGRNAKRKSTPESE